MVIRLLKPSWVSHEGKPIFSVDIHPDGSRFATGGQGDNSGKVAIWNMEPVREEKSEKDENVPKLLCQMDNHLACVNCVRWSNNGMFLASAGDDKLIMIWQSSRASSMSSVFGSGGKQVNYECWRVKITLRGHSGDILDIAWSPHGTWLASCSVDNTIIVWNAVKFPEQVTVLRGHTGLVKGLAWDPVGKYLASQSDDRSVRVWRTCDWQQDARITEPFQECSGTTHVLRLNWSPDGLYLVSAHAMNNAGPTAQIIERDGWKTAMDFVGHRKAITCVRFSSRIFTSSKKFSKSGEYSCCAIGSKDRSLSVWVTASKRPLVVLHDLFTSSILDISWGSSGLELVCCSWDGTVAYFDFSSDDIGAVLSDEEKLKVQEQIYGRSIHNTENCLGNRIIESAELLSIQEEKDHQEKLQLLQLEQQQKQQQRSQSQPIVFCSDSNSVSKPTNRQIETRTKDGRRRITPIFLAPQPDVSEMPLPFMSGGAVPVFSSSKEASQIVVEKKDEVTSPVSASKFKESSRSAADMNGGPGSSKPPVAADGAVRNGKLDPQVASAPPASLGTTISAKLPEQPATDVTSRVNLDLLEDAPKKKDGRGRPRKDRVADHYPLQQMAALPPYPMQLQEMGNVSVRPQLTLPLLSIQKNFNVQISEVADGSAWLEVENEIQAGTFTLHRARCMRNSRTAWETIFTSWVVAAAGNSFVACVACKDCTLNVFSMGGGRRICPPIALDSFASVLRCSGVHVMVITSNGSVSVWNFKSFTAILKNESVSSLLANGHLLIEKCTLTDQGLPVLSFSNGLTFTFKVELGCWTQLASSSDILFLFSDHKNCVSGSSVMVSGPLASLQSQTLKDHASTNASRLFRSAPSLQPAATVSYLENQIQCCLSLKSANEYKKWLLTYIRYLVNEAMETKLREVCDELLGPPSRGRVPPSRWDSTVLGFQKSDLLREILQIVGMNVHFQRLFTEYQEQLSSSQTTSRPS